MARACWSSDLTATNRIVGRNAASVIASASAAWFLCRLTKGLTYTGGSNRTVCPSRSMVRPQSCTVAQAAIATTHLG